MQEKSQGSASRNSFLKFVSWVAVEQNNNNNNEKSDSSQFYSDIRIVRKENLRPEAESSAGK